MKIIHGEGYPEDERRKYIHTVYHNVCASIQTLVGAMQKLEIEYGDENNAVSIIFGFQLYLLCIFTLML